MHRLLSFCSALALTLSASAQDFFSPEAMVVAGSKVYGMLPPDVLGSSGFSQIGWSSDGKFLFGLRTDLTEFMANFPTGPGELKQEIIVYNLRKHTSKLVFAPAKRKMAILDVQWMSGTDTLYATVVEHADGQGSEPPSSFTHIYRIETDGKVTEVASGNTDDAQLSIEFAPKAPFALIGHSTFSVDPVTKRGSSETKYTPILGDGRVIEGPSAKESYLIGWDEGGSKAVLRTFERLGTGKFKLHHFLYDPLHATLDEIEGSVAQPASEAFVPTTSGAAPAQKGKEIKLHREIPLDFPITVVQGSGRAFANAFNAQIKPYFLSAAKDDNSKSLICSDADAIQLSPTLTGVAYISQGVAMVRPLAEVPKEIYDAMLLAKAKTKAIINAKQVGTALLMYAADYDDDMLNPKADIKEALGPYLKNNELLDGFVYTFSGGNAADIKEPANTIIGYTVGPGGKAIVYADGHVKWKDDK